MKFNQGALNSAPLDGEWHVGQAAAEVGEGADALATAAAVGIAANAAVVDVADALATAAAVGIAANAAVNELDDVVSSQSLVAVTGDTSCVEQNDSVVGFAHVEPNDLYDPFAYDSAVRTRKKKDDAEALLLMLI